MCLFTSSRKNILGSEKREREKNSRYLLDAHIFEYIYIFGWFADGLFHFFSGDKMLVCLYVSMCVSECLFLYKYISMNVCLL